MAAFLFLLALIGGALVGDLVWENTGAGEATVLGRTVDGYPQGWLLSTAAALGFVVALLLVASVSSTRARRARRRRLRAIKRDQQQRDIEPAGDYARWLDESFGRHAGAADADPPPPRESEPVYEQTRRAAGPRDYHHP
jgi:hypothetical protein